MTRGARPEVVLTVAGFDPSAGAGIAADLKVFAAHRLYGMACITSLTVQSTLGVRRVEPVTSATIRDTLQMLAEDVVFAGVKIGMLATEGAVNTVAAFLRQAGPVENRIVLDPVLISSSGHELLDPPGLAALRHDLLGLVGWITPNFDELAILSGAPVTSKEDVPFAAATLRDFASWAGNPGLNILVTGGHLDPPDDYLSTGAGVGTWLRGERIHTRSTHGTGCALSSALLCRLVIGDSPHDAAVNAKAYVAKALKTAFPVGRGNGPMNHLFNLP